LPQRKNNFTATKTNRLMQFRGTISAYWGYVWTLITFSGQNAEFWYLTVRGTYSNHWVLKDKVRVELYIYPIRLHGGVTVEPSVRHVIVVPEHLESWRQCIRLYTDNCHVRLDVFPVARIGLLLCRLYHIRCVSRVLL
jgi:hypothetical protein